MKKRNMKIFIIGTGEIGQALATDLSKDGCDVTMVDKKEDIIDSMTNSIDAIGYQGNGASYNTLKELNAAGADILIAVTNSDEMNLLSCFTAHKLGTRHTIARVRDTDYARQSHFYRQELGISMILNPDLATASEIFRTLRFPAATRVEVFAGGRAELVELTVRDESPMVGHTLMEIGKDLGVSFLICAVVRDGEAFVPKGNTVIHAKDVIYLTGSDADFKASFKKLKHPIKPLTNVMMAGNDSVAYYLAQLLTDHGIKTTIVEENENICYDLATRLPKAAVMKDDPLKYIDSMSESDLENTDAFIAVTNDDSTNLIDAMYAETKGIGKIVTRVAAKSRIKVIHKDSIISVVCREDVAADRILGYTRAMLNVEDMDAVESLYRLVDGRLEFIEFNVKDNDIHIGQPLKMLRLKSNILLAGIIRNNRMIIPHGDDMLLAGDIALVASVDHQLSDLGDIYE